MWEGDRDQDGPCWPFMAGSIGRDRLSISPATSPGGMAPGWSPLHVLARATYADLGEADFIRAAGRMLRRAEDRAKRAGAPNVAAILDTGDPATRIVYQAEANAADLIVMGRRGLGDLGGLLLGSVSHKVAQLASCACLTVT